MASRWSPHGCWILLTNMPKWHVILSRWELIMNDANEKQKGVIITYCVECEYLPLAGRLANRIEAELGITPVLTEGHGGIFAVRVGDKEVFNNLKQGGYVPSDPQIIEMARREIEPLSASTTSRQVLHDVMNPRGNPPLIQPTAMAPRLDRLKDKTVFLVDARSYREIRAEITTRHKTEEARIMPVD